MAREPWCNEWWLNGPESEEDNTPSRDLDDEEITNAIFEEEL